MFHHLAQLLKSHLLKNNLINTVHGISKSKPNLGLGADGASCIVRVVKAMRRSKLKDSDKFVHIRNMLGNI